MEQTPESIAKFLFRQERLSKKQIGNIVKSSKEKYKNLSFLFQENIWEVTVNSTKKCYYNLSSAMNLLNFYWSKPCGNFYGAFGK